MRYQTLICIGLSLLLAAPVLGQDAQPTSRESRSIARRAELQLKQAEEQYAATAAELDQLQQKLRAVTGRLDVSSESLQKAAARLDEKLEQLQLEEVGSAARRKGTEHAIEEQTVRAASRVDSDAVVAALQKVVTLRQQQLKEATSMYKAGVETKANLDATEAAVADAQAKVAERQHAVFTGGDSEALSALRRDMLNMTIGEQERAARIDFLRKQQSQLSDGISLVPRLQRVQEAVESARHQLDRAQENEQTIRIYGDIDDAPRSSPDKREP